MSYQPQIYTVGQMTENAGCKVCVYGRAGTGKTKLISTCPAPLTLSTEQGLLSLRKEFSHLPVVAIRSMKELVDTRKWVYESREARQFGTFALDSITDIGETVLTYEKSKTTNKLRAYGEMADQILQEFRYFRDLSGPHVYFIAKQETVKDNAGNFYRPWMPGQQLPQAMPYFWDEVLQLNMGKDNQGNSFRYLRCQPDAFNEAKDRSGRLEEYERPDLGYIFAKMLG